MTPLQLMVKGDDGPPRLDGSDKYFGLENVVKNTLQDDEVSYCLTATPLLALLASCISSLEMDLGEREANDLWAHSLATHGMSHQSFQLVSTFTYRTLFYQQLLQLYPSVLILFETIPRKHCQLSSSFYLSRTKQHPSSWTCGGRRQ